MFCLAHAASEINYIMKIVQHSTMPMSSICSYEPETNSYSGSLTDDENPGINRSFVGPGGGWIPFSRTGAYALSGTSTRPGGIVASSTHRDEEEDW